MEREHLQSSTESNPAWKAFSIPELLEQILLSTSYIDVFVVQRVSKVFNNTILDSPKLQRKLIKAPDRMGPTSYCSCPSCRQATQVSSSQIGKLLTSGQLQLLPFVFCRRNLPQTDDNVLAFSYHVSDGCDYRMGWLGKSHTVYETGTWRSLEVEVGRREIRLIAHGCYPKEDYMDKRIDMKDVTLGDFFDVLKDLRSKFALSHLEKALKDLTKAFTPGTLPELP